MADQVLKGGLILTDWADNMAKVDAARYDNILRNQAQEQYAQKQAVDTAANLARQRFAGGNVDAARQTAAGGNAWDVWQSIDTDQKAKVAAQATDIGTAAFNLGKLPKGQARVDYFNSFVPTLRSHGMSDQEITQYAHSGFLDDDNALAGYRDKAIGIKEMYDTEQTRIKDERAHEYRVSEDAAKPITAADGAVLVRGADGSLAPIYTPGSKPESQFIKNEDGSTSYVSVPGTAGTSYTPGAGSGAKRTMGWTPRAQDGNSHASVDNKVALIARGVGADADAPLGQQAFLSLDMTQLEGRPAAPNNLGNMKNTDGSWKRFNSPAEYQSAQRAWLQRRWNEGARTVRDAVEGRPVGAAPQGAGPRPATNGIETVNLGGGRTGPLWVDETRQIAGQNVSGQRNQQTGEFKPLGGAAAKATKPVDFDSDIASLNNTIGITERLYHHPGLSAVVGVPGFTGGLLGGKVIPGTDAAGFTSLMKNFDANAYLAQVTKMKGMGALSDAEGARLSAAIGSLSVSQSETEFMSNLAGVRKDLELARSRLIQKRNAARSGGSSPQAETRTVNGRTYVKVQGGWRAQ